MAGFKSTAKLAAMALAALAVASAGTPAAAGFFKPGKAAQAIANLDIATSEFDRAMQEQRLVDAGRILDGALVVAPTDPRLMLRSGELHLARGRFDEAARSFALAEAAPALNAQALQGRGVALAQLGRSDEAIAILRRAVAVDPALWRAWNALGVESDRRRDWATAEAAYAKAIATPSADEIVYNNRGYSRLLQGRYSEASADFVAALDRDPTLTAARMNLRLSLALQGDYARATAVGDKDQKAGVLNNAGFAAVLRGDLEDAQRLFEQAIDNRGSTYGRAYHNLELVKAMKAGQPDIAPGPAKP
ncbi:tetratricopeptide repeat protein [Phenylobacterium sp.]|uniref:tetratricopeptide repeat protein n=1 Tax=Phenylobacterium sp. TaxID=1871053 RepID=UPI002FC97B04